MRLQTVGRISAGRDHGWYIWIDRGLAPGGPRGGTAGYLAHINAALDFSGSPTLFVWGETRDDLERLLDEEGRSIEWTDAGIPERFAGRSG